MSPNGRITVVEQRDLFTNVAQSYFLRAPAVYPPVKVFLNGLLMCEGIDYILLGAGGARQELRFTAQQIGAEPIIQVFYCVPV